MAGDLAYVAVITADGFGLGIAQRGKAGYHPTNYPSVDTYAKAGEWRDVANARLGLTELEAEEIVISSFVAQAVGR